METETTRARDEEPVLQFSVFADNKVGRLNDLVQRLTQRGLHILAMSQLDSTECTIMRIIPDYPEEARAMLRDSPYAFTESEILVVELNAAEDLKYVTAALVEAEINIHYLYPFLVRPREKSALALNLEDNEFAESVLHAHQVKVLKRHDLAR
jgi:hypothetical protein